MRLTIPALLITALIASPAAFAQGTNYTGTTSKPGASFEKDDSATPAKQPKKHAMSHRRCTMPSTRAPKLRRRALADHQPVLAQTKTTQRPSRGSLVRQPQNERAADLRLFLSVRLDAQAFAQGGDCHSIMV